MKRRLFGDLVALMEEHATEIERPKPHQRTEENHAEITCDTFFEFPLAQVPSDNDMAVPKYVEI